MEEREAVTGTAVAGAHRHHAEPVGALLRPSALAQARARDAAGDIGDAELAAAADRAVADAIRRQEQAGLDVVTDGELRRGSFLGPLAEALSGLERTDTPAVPLVWHGDGASGDEVLQWEIAVVDRVALRRSPAADEYRFAAEHATRPVKVTLPSPLMMVNFWHPERSRDAYADIWELFADAADAIRVQARELAALGCHHIQIDAPEFAKLVDEEGRRFHASVGAPPERMLTDGIDLLNTIPAGIDGVTFGIHMCRGNHAGRWRSAGGYDAVTEAFERLTAFDTYFLEYDDDRSGGFEPLAHVPGDKVVALGLVTTKRPELERPDVLLRRIDEASRFVDRDRLELTPQCGFASSAVGNPLTEDDQWAKLALVAAVAREAFGARR